MRLVGGQEPLLVSGLGPGPQAESLVPHEDPGEHYPFQQAPQIQHYISGRHSEWRDGDNIL
jgi:hypothetical protein